MNDFLDALLKISENDWLDYVAAFASLAISCVAIYLSMKNNSIIQEDRKQSIALQLFQERMTVASEIKEYLTAVLNAVQVSLKSISVKFALPQKELFCNSPIPKAKYIFKKSISTYCLEIDAVVSRCGQNLTQIKNSLDGITMILMMDHDYEREYPKLMTYINDYLSKRINNDSFRNVLSEDTLSESIIQLVEDQDRIRRFIDESALEKDIASELSKFIG